MSLKLTHALEMLGVQMEVELEDELSDVVPEEYMTRAKEAVHNALIEARRNWETKTLDEVFGHARANHIRSRIQELTLE